MTPAVSASARIALLKVRRSPRCWNWRGRKPSRASTEESSGNPLKAVFAARNRMSAVKVVMKTKAGEPSPKTADATWATIGSWM